MRVLGLASCLVLAACGCSPPATESAADGGAAVVPAYDGPELKTTLETKETHPPQYEMVVDVHCPTGGYTFVLHDFDGKSNPRVARFILTAPATDELVFQAFEHHTERVDLGTARTPVRVLVSQRRRRSPEADRQPFQLAATVTPQ